MELTFKKIGEAKNMRFGHGAPPGGVEMRTDYAVFNEKNKPIQVGGHDLVVSVMGTNILDEKTIGEKAASKAMLEIEEDKKRKEDKVESKAPVTLTVDTDKIGPMAMPVRMELPK